MFSNSNLHLPAYFFQFNSWGVEDSCNKAIIYTYLILFFICPNFIGQSHFWHHSTNLIFLTNQHVPKSMRLMHIWCFFNQYPVVNWYRLNLFFGLSYRFCYRQMYRLLLQWLVGFRFLPGLTLPGIMA
jgi:hypothetical protein